MPLDHAFVSTFRKDGVCRTYAARDACFYALSLGFGSDPLNEPALDHVLEFRGPRTIPTMAAVLVRSLSHDLGLDMPKVLHGEQRLTIHRPIPPSADLVIDAHVTSVLDKGSGKGAIVSFDSVARNATDSEMLFTLGHTLFARGDGGFGGPSGPAPARHTLPDRRADMVHRLETRPEQALFYRLNGDLNPLHADPATAQRAGFTRPILHGLATYGLACRAVMEAVLGNDGNRIAAFDVRFTSPVYPGEMIETDLWVDGDTLSYRCRVPARDIVAIDNGRCTLRV